MTIFKDILRWLIIPPLMIYACTVVYWLAFPYKVIDVNSITIQNTDKVVKQGGVLIYKIDYAKHMDIVGTVHRQLVNTYTITYSDTVAMSPVGAKVTNTHLPIPEYASPGTYHLLWKVKYQVNPMRSIIVTVLSDEFFVVRGDHPGDKGEKWDTGATWKEGPQGEQGETGKSGASYKYNADDNAPLPKRRLSAVNQYFVENEQCVHLLTKHLR